MARWMLTEDHYIHVYRPRRGPTEWEYKEIDQMTGEEIRTRFAVPLYIEKGMIVSTKGSELPTDNGPVGPYVWVDSKVEPTCNMTPLDEAARELSANLPQPFGWDPFDDLPTQGGFADKLISGLEKQMAELLKRLPEQGPVADSGVSREEFAALQAQLAQLIAEKAEREPQVTQPRRSLRNG